MSTEGLRAKIGFQTDAHDAHALVGLNVRDGQRLLGGSMSRAGKFTVLRAPPGEEFIFGDGFLHNISHLSSEPWTPRCLVPLTPELAIFYTRPTSSRLYPRAFALNLTADGVRFVNDTTQVYAASELFFRTKRPSEGVDFDVGEHRQYQYDKHPWLSGLELAMAEGYFGSDQKFYVPGELPE
jgi:hypothetical protein